MYFCYIYLYECIYGPNIYFLFYDFFFLICFEVLINAFGNQTRHFHRASRSHTYAHGHTHVILADLTNQPSTLSDVTVLPEDS